MNVLLSAYACLPDAGSEPGNGWGWAMSLAKRGMTVHVLTVIEGRDRIESYRKDHPTPGVNFSYVSIPTSLFKECSGIHYVLWQWSALRVARELMRHQVFDIAHHVTFGSIHVPTQLWRLGIPTVFGPVGGGQTAPASMLSYFGESRGKEKRRTLLTRLLRHSPLHRAWLGRMSAVLVSNGDTMELAKTLGRRDTAMMFDAAIPSKFGAPAPRRFEGTPNPLRLLWVGRLLPRKAISLTLDILAKTTCPSTLTIIGDGVEPSVMGKMIADRGLDGRVFAECRRLPWPEVRAAYLDHDAMLFTSLRDSCAPQLLEAMAMGLPIITLDIHGAADLVPNNAGIKVPVETKGQVIGDAAAAIEQYASLPSETRTAMSEVGWALSHDMTYDARARYAEHLYRSLSNASRNSDMKSSGLVESLEEAI
jgi:glycosyltransferase involved in cell wall biosynthesis